MRSRCQTFVFQRPRLHELVTLLRRVAEGEGIQAPDSALSLIARSAARLVPRRRLDPRPARRGDEQLDRCAVRAPARRRRRRGVAAPALRHGRRPRHGRSARSSSRSSRSRDRISAALVPDLLEHLRELLLVQHMGYVPESLPVTEETKERLREQANQIPEPTVLRLIDLLARRGRRHPPGRRSAAAARDRAREGDPARRGSLARVARTSRRAARVACAERAPMHRGAATASEPPRAPEPIGRRPKPACARAPSLPRRARAGHGRMGQRHHRRRSRALDPGRDPAHRGHADRAPRTTRSRSSSPRAPTSTAARSPSRRTSASCATRSTR